MQLVMLYNIGFKQSEKHPSLTLVIRTYFDMHSLVWAHLVNY